MTEIPLWSNGAPGSETWTQLEKEFWTPPESPERFRLVRNVTRPTLTVFLPDPSISTGTAAIVSRLRWIVEHSLKIASQKNLCLST